MFPEARRLQKIFADDNHGDFILYVINRNHTKYKTDNYEKYFLEAAKYDSIEI